jgi:hypothetical protein
MKITAACDWTKPTTPACEKLLTQMHTTVGNINLYATPRAHDTCLHVPSFRLRENGGWLGEARRD